MNAKTIEIQKDEICELGRGAFGKVCEFKGKGTKTYAVKISRRSDYLEDLRNERDKVIKFYYSLPMYYKRYFVKPYYVKFKGDSSRHKFSYAMEMVPNVQDAKTYLNKLYTENKTKIIRLIIRRIRHALYALWKGGIIHRDLHLKNIIINTKTNMPKIIDFGQSKQTIRRVPLETLKTTGTKRLEKLDDDIYNWFKAEFALNSGFGTGNPNIVFFPGKVKRYNYHATSHYNNISRYIVQV